MSGPWTAEFSECGGYDCMTDAWRIYEDDPFRRTIAVVDLGHYGQTSRDRALRPGAEKNARLIAAAPELLEALKAASQFLQPDIHRGPDSNGWVNTIALVDAAIAKAEGVSAGADGTGPGA